MNIESTKKRLRRRPLPAVIPVRALGPTIITVLALCAGVSAIRFGAQENWKMAVAAILVAALFDSLDGRVARMIKGTSRFGAELDSLSDVICFGVSPAMVLYFWALQGLGGIGWAISLFYCVCCALRLARFNVADRTTSDEEPVARFFTGLPAPGSAILLLLPLLIDFSDQLTLEVPPFVAALYMMALALLMISRIRTFSLKHIHIEREYVLPILLAVGALVGLLTSFFWTTLVVLSVMYILSLPISIYKYRNHDPEGDATA